MVWWYRSTQTQQSTFQRQQRTFKQKTCFFFSGSKHTHAAASVLFIRSGRTVQSFLEVRILNSICHQPLDAEPLDSSPFYDEATDKRSEIAGSPGWTRVCTQGGYGWLAASGLENCTCVGHRGCTRSVRGSIRKHYIAHTNECLATRPGYPARGIAPSGVGRDVENAAVNWRSIPRDLLLSH